MNQRPLPTDHSLLIFLLALFLVNSPLRQWWSTLSLPWYAMYLPWLLIIALLALNQHRQKRNLDRGD
ncbi:UTP--glucose-1-phosphate uridylyltransferase [Granulosicoccus sp. 3-233]|uniref:UTP--glucose-1-phosphate uridylyltransferase n=1 Tax=Granulosicoccus sp. 3-233 TaxID=3417969 RepID=UPI003D3548DA